MALDLKAVPLPPHEKFRMEAVARSLQKEGNVEAMRDCIQTLMRYVAVLTTVNNALIGQMMKHNVPMPVFEVEEEG